MSPRENNRLSPADEVAPVDPTGASTVASNVASTVAADGAEAAQQAAGAPKTGSGGADDAATIRDVARKGGNRGGGPWGSSMPTEKSLNFGPSAKRLLGRLAPQRVRVASILLLTLIGVGLSVIGPKVLGRATDIIFNGFTGRSLGGKVPAGSTKEQAITFLRGAGQQQQADMLAAMNVTPGTGVDFGALARVLLLVLGIYVISAVFLWMQGYLLATAVNLTVRDLRTEAETKLNRMPLSYFDREQRGEVLSRVTNDVDNVSQSLQQTMSQLLTSLLTLIGVLVMMLTISPLLTLIALVAIPLSVLLTATIAKRSQRQFITQWRSTGELNAQVEEFYSGHALVKVFGRQHDIQESFRAKNSELFESSFKAQFVSGMIMPVMMFIGNLTYVLVAVVGGLRVASGALSLGNVQAFIQYSRQFTQPLSQVASMANVLQSGVASAERVFELLDEPEQIPDPSVPATIPVSERHGRVEFEHVAFSYVKDSPLIRDLSLQAEPGHTVAIVGPTGAGKTTLVNLILRFYELDAGRITLDGVDIATLTRDELRSGVGMVLQDTWLFGGTIRENIAYGNPEATQTQIVEAATATYVDRFVRSLPDGYETVIDSEGSNVSAGEKQLITIARAFLADPSLLILDEATSSVDTRTELLVQQAMAALRSDRTSFVIAHRLSTIRDADLILVMQDGSIVEQGTHDELLDAGGAYAALYASQFAAPTAPGDPMEPDAAMAAR